AKAKERGLDKLGNVEKQSAWWKDKITSGMVKNEIKNSIDIDIKEIKIKENVTKTHQQEYNAKLFRKIQSLKKEYTVKIYDDVLNAVPVSSENDQQVIDFYTVKKGGLIPRMPYPTIDYEWINWE
ncbi:MAG TPA: hypothetical protein VHO28_01670, partial [Ignavibacteriales bacterium]|nr:hypothetical protein [Ignavibacteriales bacterium]